MWYECVKGWEGEKFTQIFYPKCYSDFYPNCYSDWLLNMLSFDVYLGHRHSSEHNMCRYLTEIKWLALFECVLLECVLKPKFCRLIICFKSCTNFIFVIYCV